jgi:hypothetical protein
MQRGESVGPKLCEVVARAAKVFRENAAQFPMKGHQNYVRVTHAFSTFAARPRAARSASADAAGLSAVNQGCADCINLLSVNRDCADCIKFLDLGSLSANTDAIVCVPTIRAGAPKYRFRKLRLRRARCEDERQEIRNHTVLSYHLTASACALFAGPLD